MSELCLSWNLTLNSSWNDFIEQALEIPLLSLTESRVNDNYVLCFSGQGETLVSILIDLNGFWTYENRESMVTDTADNPSDV